MTRLKLSDLFYVGESAIHGRGLFAKRSIRAGDYIGTYRGPLCVDEESAGPHVLWVEQEDGEWLGRDGRNVLRYMNHHPKPCAQFEGFDLYALTDIAAGSEVTIHYGEEFDGVIQDRQ